MAERALSQSHDNHHVGSYPERSRRHQTSINIIMGPGPESDQQPNERTRLLDSASGGQPQMNTLSSSRPVSRVRKSAGRVGFLSQVWLLLWKNFLLQKRSVAVTIAEILIPLIGAVIMLIVRQVVTVTETTSPTTWDPLSLGPEAAKFLNRSGLTMLYAPNSTLINSVMTNVNATLHADGLSTEVKGFSSEDEIIRMYQINQDDNKLYPVTVIFDVNPNASALPPDLTYKIRPETKDDDKWQTRNVYPFFQRLVPRDSSDDLYYNRSFVYTQRIVSEALIKQWQGGQLNVSTFSLQRIPYPPYIDDVMVQVLQLNFPNILMFSFILSVIIMCKNIVYEKERQLKESMKLMGMSAAAHWTSWFLQFFIYLVVASAIYTLFMSVAIGDKEAVLVFSDPSLMFVFLVAYSISIISYSFLIGTITNKANIGAALGGILYFATFFPYYFLEERYETMNLGEKLGACVLFNMAMSYGLKTIGLYEGTGKGAQWDSFTKPASVDDNFSLLHAILMLILDSFICLVLTWYLDNVRPGTYGIARPWYFPFQSSYWCGSGRKSSDYTPECVDSNDSKHFEREPVGLPVGISMQHLRKVFDKSKVAVKDSTLTMYEGQITVLLGHNGAGKTTTMSMLTGFMPPSSGTAYVNGYDIRTDINSVRNNLGLCPQHNILFETLTVDEHLTFFARLKGCPKNEIPAAVAEMAKEVGLETKRKARAGTLSGGQKRKLSVGIALIGGSKIVILDEPTSGMDPAARRQTWDVLQRHRVGRTMLLSTHFMDEADLLGDRIAIMAEGVVKCCGTSMFLKKLYGAGYHLVIVKGPECDVSAITEVVQRMIPGAQLESEVGLELSYLLPEKEAPKFAQLFRLIEEQNEKLGITNFGATATTMEEVFLKVGASAYHEETEDSAESASALPPATSVISGSPRSTSPSDNKAAGYVNPNYIDDPVVSKTEAKTSDSGSNLKHDAGNTNGNALNGMASSDTVLNASELTAATALDNNYTHVRGFKLNCLRFWGMLVKKAIHTMRNRLISGVQLALPVLFTIAALTVDKTRPNQTEDPPLLLNLSMFDGSVSAYTSGLNSTAESLAMAASYRSLFKGSDTIQAINRSQYADINDFYVKEAEQVGLYTYSQKVVIGGQFEPSTQQVNVIGWYSGQPLHAMPVSLAYVMDAMVKQVVGPDHSLTAINHPMPKGNLAAAKDSMNTALQLSFSIGFSMLFGMAFLTSSFCYFLIRERQTGAKHLQVVSGVGPFAFWVASFTWDMINYMMPCFLLLIVFAAFQVDAYTEDGNLALVFLVLVVFGVSVLPFTYILQFPFKVPATGFVVLIILAIISGLFTMLTVVILRIPSLKTEDVADVLDWAFMSVFPHYNLGMSFSNMYINKLDNDFCAFLGQLCPESRLFNQSNPCCKDICGEFCMPYEENYLAWDYPGIGRSVLFLCVQSVVYFALTLAIDFQLPQKLAYLCGSGKNVPLQPQSGTINSQTAAEEDTDVAQERSRVSSGGAQGDTLVLDSLYKQYNSFLAVDQISVGVPEQECFGLLGQNGAGKTTTFKMLTGDVMVTSGDAFVRQYSIKTDIKRVQANMGYCPQFDALIDQMTGRETLTMYARLRGVPPSRIRHIVDNLLTLLMLEPHADKWTVHYSGGNKRKLSTAIALIGGPAVILLDEPSSGMDPGARRQLWNVLSQVRASGRTLILTSHSMEECDALCTRIAIMVNGQFKCLGSPQHLKSKFGQGYTLIAKMAVLPNGYLASSQPLVDAIFRKFPGTQKFDDHQGYVHFQVPNASIPLSEVFEAMEKAKTELSIEDYSVHQTTLEQIFLTFTRAQYLPREAKSKSVIRCMCPCL